jgi:hypothetical protein
MRGAAREPLIADPSSADESGQRGVKRQRRPRPGAVHPWSPLDVNRVAV